MNINKSKQVVIMLGAHLIIVNAGSVVDSGPLYVYANEVKEENVKSKSLVSQEVVRYKALEKYGFAEKYNSDFAAYLKKKGVSDTEYRQYVSDTKKYLDSKEEKVYEIENLIYIFDTAIYTDKVVKSIYEINKEEVKNKEKAWDMTKKGFIYDIDWITQIYEETLSSADIEKIYKYIFKKNPTDAILKDLKNKSTLKYGLYSGLIDRELTSADRNKIAAGKGYELVGVSKEEYSDYLKYINVRIKINKHEVQYIKEYFSHLSVREKVKKKYGADIFTKLSDKQRVAVYNSSLVNFNYNDTMAEKAIRGYLIENGVIKGPSSQDEPPIDVGGIGMGSTTSPLLPEKVYPMAEDEEDRKFNINGNYGDFGRDWKALSPSEMNNLTVNHYYTGKYKLEDRKESKDKKYYNMRIGKDLYITNVVVEENFTEEKLKEVLEVSFDGLKWKVVVSNEEIMIFVNNQIVVIERGEIYNLKKLNKELNKAEVYIGEISQEEIDKLENSKEINNKESDNDV